MRLDNAELNTNNALLLATLAGEVMLTSGAETHRVEDTMRRMLEKCGLSNIDAVCTATVIFACVVDGGQTSTMVRRVKQRGNNLEKIARANELSRRFSQGEITVDQAIESLKSINAAKPYSNIVLLLGSAVASACFAAMFGGTVPDAVAAFIAAFVMQIPVNFLGKHRIAGVLRNIAGGGCGALVSLVLFNLGLGDTIDYVIVGAMMPLLPGVSLTNAIRDVLDGDLLSGAARILDALLVAIGIAVGVGAVLTTWLSVWGGVTIIN